MRRSLRSIDAGDSPWSGATDRPGRGVGAVHYAGSVPSFRPFQGLRYDPSLVSLNEVIAPPYDVVDEQGRAALASRSDYNAILVELPSDDPESGRDRYRVAADLLGQWQAKGVLRRDEEPALYGYRMEYADPAGRTVSTTGVFGALGVEDPDRGGILPHEETMSKPKGDRLYLLRATRTNLSPIWGLSLARGLTAWCTPEATGATEMVTATDTEGVVHSLWPIVDADACTRIADAVASNSVVIADGHHRFETALNYRNEQGPSEGDVRASGGAAGGVFALVVELAEEQLHVRSIHRVLSDLPADLDVAEAFAGRFALQEYTSDPAGINPDLLVAEEAIALVTGSGAWLLRDVATAGGEGSGEDVLAELDSVHLRAALDTLPAHEIDYEPRWPVALAAVRNGSSQAAVMIRPVTVDQIGRCARAGLRMPPKTTFFHPKPRTGMVFRPL